MSLPEEPHQSGQVTRHLTRRKVLERWWMLPVAATAGAFGFMGWYGSRVTFGKRGAAAPDFVPGPAKRIASLADLQADWDSVEFVYDERPCVLLRVPRAGAGSLEAGVEAGGGHFVAYSRICTHLGCPVVLVKNIEVLAFSYNYRPPKPERHPHLGCPCHYSVFDPVNTGNAVFGKAISPLPRVRLEQRGPDLYATGIEPAPKLAT